MVDARTPMAVLVAVVLAACSAPDAGSSGPGLAATIPTVTSETVRFPGNDWVREERGDWTTLDRELEQTGTSCVAVVHDGALALDDPASEQVDAWRAGPASDVTVRDLLAQVSGREWSEATDRQVIRESRDQTAYAIGLQQRAAPGECVYDNAAPQVLERVLAESVTENGDVVALAKRRLLDPLGMDDTTWPRDATGHATTHSGVTSTCPDLARFGYLMLQDGHWRDKQLVAADLVAEATKPATEENAAYGLLWWTNGEGRVVEAPRQAGFYQDIAPYEGRIAPNVPADAFWAFGYGNQYVAVVPSKNLVAVRLGRRPTSPDQVTSDSFTAGVIKALARP